MKQYKKKGVAAVLATSCMLGACDKPFELSDITDVQHEVLQSPLEVVNNEGLAVAIKLIEATDIELFDGKGRTITKAELIELLKQGLERLDFYYDKDKFKVFSITDDTYDAEAHHHEGILRFGEYIGINEVLWNGTYDETDETWSTKLIYDLPHEVMHHYDGIGNHCDEITYTSNHQGELNLHMAEATIKYRDLPYLITYMYKSTANIVFYSEFLADSVLTTTDYFIEHRSDENPQQLYSELVSKYVYETPEEFAAAYYQRHKDNLEWISAFGISEQEFEGAIGEMWEYYQSYIDQAINEAVELFPEEAIETTEEAVSKKTNETSKFTKKMR